MMPEHVAPVAQHGHIIQIESVSPFGEWAFMVALQPTKPAAPVAAIAGQP